MAHAYLPTFERWRQMDQELEVILDYSVSWKSAWTTWDAISKILISFWSLVCHVTKLWIWKEFGRDEMGKNRRVEEKVGERDTREKKRQPEWTQIKEKGGEEKCEDKEKIAGLLWLGNDGTWSNYLQFTSQVLKLAKRALHLALGCYYP